MKYLALRSRTRRAECVALEIVSTFAATTRSSAGARETIAAEGPVACRLDGAEATVDLEDVNGELVQVG